MVWSNISSLLAKWLNVQFEALFGAPFNVKFKGLFKLVCRIPPRKMKKPVNKGNVKNFSSSAFLPVSLGYSWDKKRTGEETSQELRMLSSVTIDGQITKIVMDSGSKLSELLSVSQWVVYVFVFVF